MSQAFTIKLWFRFRENKSLWANFMNEKYVKNIFPGDRTPKPSDSPMSRRLFGVSIIAQENMFWLIGTSNAYIWHDHWFPNHSVQEFQNCLLTGSIDHSLLQSWVSGDTWSIAKLNDLSSIPAS